MSLRALATAAAAAALAALAACGDNSAAPPDAFVPPPVDAAPPFMEAAHGTVPQMVKMSGDVLTTPKVVPIFFANDATMQAQVENFLGMLPGSSYWSATTSEYGVGPIQVEPTIVTTDTPPTTDTDLATWIAGHFTGTNGWPAAPDPQAIYAVYLPEGVVLHTGFGDSCQAFGGYHDETATAAQQPVIYALMPRCTGGSELDELTVVTSHELIEAATDPRVETAPAYGDLDPDHYIWAYTPGAEVGDMCEYLGSAAQHLVGTYLVQRTWSNAAALAGHDPCVPALSGAYMAAAPMLTDSVPLDSIYGGTIMTKGVEVPVGTSKTIDVNFFTDVPTESFSVAAVDVASFGGPDPELTFSWDNQFGTNGAVRHLTITRAKAAAMQGSEFLLVVVRGHVQQSLWWGFAGN